mgnify:CR=1 FL=1
MEKMIFALLGALVIIAVLLVVIEKHEKIADGLFVMILFSMISLIHYWMKIKDFFSVHDMREIITNFFSWAWNIILALLIIFIGKPILFISSSVNKFLNNFMPPIEINLNDFNLK